MFIQRSYIAYHHRFSRTIGTNLTEKMIHVQDLCSHRWCYFVITKDRVRCPDHLNHMFCYLYYTKNIYDFNTRIALYKLGESLGSFNGLYGILFLFRVFIKIATPAITIPTPPTASPAIPIVLSVPPNPS